MFHHLVLQAQHIKHVDGFTSGKLENDHHVRILINKFCILIKNHSTKLFIMSINRSNGKRATYNLQSRYMLDAIFLLQFNGLIPSCYSFLPTKCCVFHSTAYSYRFTIIVHHYTAPTKLCEVNHEFLKNQGIFIASGSPPVSKGHVHPLTSFLRLD